jgi:hypothetical protein
MKLMTPELVHLTKPKNNKLISYGSNFDLKLVYSLAWIYKYYFEESVTVVLPKIVQMSTLDTFNELTGTFPLTPEEILTSSLECMENIKSKVVIYGFSDFIFNDLVVLNKRRVCTYLRSTKSKVHILGWSSLSVLDIHVSVFEYYELGTQKDLDPNYIDFEDIEEFVQENHDKKIYISVANPVKLTGLQSLLDCSETETGQPGVVLQNSRVLHRGFLKYNYDIYIFITKLIEQPLDLFYYLKETGTGEVYFDAARVKSTTALLESLQTEETVERLTVKDSIEFENYDDLAVEVPDGVIVSEGYYRFDPPKNIKQLDLRNLSKRDYDLIRSFVKTKLVSRLDLDVKTCQLASPCSPRDRAKKLNSLANKISSYDYRCNVNCQIFSDYSIGVVIWNETFSDRKELNVEKDQSFIYQTTNGKWKYTTVR